MNRWIFILTIFIGIFLSAIFIEKSYSIFIEIILILVLLGYLIFEFYKINNKKIEGDFIFYKQTKRIQPLFIVLAIAATIGYFINSKKDLFQIILFWSIVIFDIITSFITNKVKPIGIVIKANYLICNDSNNTKRDLNKVKSLKLNGFTSEIEMNFEEEKRILIKQSEYLNIDIEKLVSLCIEKSNGKVSISENLKC
jgi:hypothetical protein